MTMVPQIKARDLLEIPETEIYDRLPPVFDLVFDDGEVLHTNRRRTVFSRFFWEYHRRFPKIPLKKNHHLQPLMEKKGFNSGTHTDLAREISYDIYACYPPTPDLPDIISEIAYRQSTGVSNHEIPRLAPYANSIDLLDGIELYRHPPIEEAREKVVKDPTKFGECYKLVETIIRTDPTLDRNNLARACRNNTVKMGQVMQSVFMLFRRAEADGKLFDVPVNTGYIEGIQDPYSFTADSRSAPKAQAGTEAPLQDSAYMARRFQLMMSVVEKIEHDDCGSRDYIDWPVQPVEYDDDGKPTYPGGIHFMKGKYILDKDTGQEIELTGTKEEADKYNGTIVKLRAVQTCKNPNPHTVCRRCFGGLWRNYYEHQNLGHLCSVQFTERVIQNTLGIKHLAASGQGEGIRYNALSLKFFRQTRKVTNYVLQPMLKRMDLKITLTMAEAVRLVDVIRMENMQDLRVNKITALTDIRVDYVEKGRPLFDIVPINQGSRPAFATMEFIKYIKEKGFEDEPAGNFKIDMKDWDYDKPVFAIPEMEKSDAEHGQEVGKLIESNMANINDRQNPDSPLSTLQELFELVTSKMDMQLSCLEVMLYALMVPSRNNHSLARGWSQPVLSVARTLITSRSLAPAYMFQGHVNFMLDPKAFFPHFRPDTKMDVFFAPDQVVRRYVSNP